MFIITRDSGTGLHLLRSWNREMNELAPGYRIITESWPLLQGNPKLLVGRFLGEESDCAEAEISQRYTSDYPVTDPIQILLNLMRSMGKDFLEEDKKPFKFTCISVRSDCSRLMGLMYWTKADEEKPPEPTLYFFSMGEFVQRPYVKVTTDLEDHHARLFEVTRDAGLGKVGRVVAKYPLSLDLVLQHAEDDAKEHLSKTQHLEKLRELERLPFNTDGP
jgi:hypothetical protein